MKFKTLLEYNDNQLKIEVGDIIEVTNYDGDCLRINCKGVLGAPISIEFVKNFCERIKE